MTFEGGILTISGQKIQTTETPDGKVTMRMEDAMKLIGGISTLEPAKATAKDKDQPVKKPDTEKPASPETPMSKEEIATTVRNFEDILKA